MSRRAEGALLVGLFALVGSVNGCTRDSRSQAADVDAFPDGASAGGAEGGAADASRAASRTASRASRTASPDASPDAAPDAPPDPAAVLARGKLLYGRYCNFCHGDEGQGYVADHAPRLASDDLLALVSDEFLRDAIVKGRPGTTMSSWSFARRGPLSHEDAAAIVKHLRSWQKRPSEPLEARATAGDATRGAPLYAAHCASCHGPKGSAGKYNALANPELLASASDAFLATTIERGRAGTPMNGFAGKLSKEKIDDVVALLRSWQRPPEEVPELPPRPGSLASVVLNPGGPQPTFDAKADFVPVDDVKREVDRKATMIIIDARPSSDYARMHIAGAISVPFYEVNDYAKQLPKERYILTYCGCPHAESGKVRDALRALGYPRAAVMDEGLFAWRDRGYPVRGGRKP
jgi:cytochrome c oxidase cbb3-type subunit 3/ubiquinol-cytochrome c reductase cytochrome c subunit